MPFRDVLRDEAAPSAPPSPLDPPVARPMNGFMAAIGAPSGPPSGEPNRETGGTLSGVDSRWRAIVENVSDMIAEVDENGLYTFLSPSHGEATGFAASDLIGRPSIEDVHPEDRPVLMQHLERLREPGDQVRVRVRVRNAAGAWRWFESAVRLRVDEAGLRFYVIVARDAGERHRIEQERSLLQRLSRAVNDEADLGGVARALSRLLRPLLFFDLLFISLLDPSDASRIVIAASDLEQGDASEVKLSTDPRYIAKLRARMEENAVVCNNDFVPDTMAQWASESGRPCDEWPIRDRSNANTRAFINVPLAVDGTPLGMLHFDAFRPHVFNEEHVRLAELVAGQISGALKRLQLLEAAHAAEERLSELIRQLDAIVWEADPQTRTVTFVSSQVKEWVGCEPEAWLGDMRQNFGRFVHPDDRERVLDECARAAEQRGDHTLEYRILKKKAAPDEQVLEAGHAQVLGEGEAEVLWVRNISKVEQREGVPVRLHGLMLDITARKRDSDLLHQNEEKFRAIFEGALDAMLILDGDARLVEVNAATGELLGAPSADLPGRAIEDFVEPRARKAFRREWRKYLERGQARGEFRLRRADGSLIQVEFASRADFLPGRHGAVVRDISQRKATDATLQLLERAVEAAGTGILMLDALAPSHPILYVNEAWERITGRAQEEALGKPFPEWNGFDSGPALSRLQTAVAEQRAGRETLRKTRPDGRIVWTELSLSPVRDDKGTVTHFIVVEADISERREAEETVRQTNAILQATQEAAADGIFLVDESGSVVSCNRRFEQMWQIPEPVVEELRADDQLMFYILSMMADPDEFLERIAFLVAHPRASTRDEVRLNDGRIFERYSAPAVSPEGHTYGRVWSFSDITERKSTEHQLRHQAFHDALTGLPNRAYFMDTLTRVLTRARRATGPAGEPAGETVAVLFLDLDRFKIINDSLGHETGDQLLIEASRRLHGCLRPGDLAARFGGDEFTVLLNDVRHISDATRVAERIADVLTIPFELSGHEVFTTTSVGIVLSREGGDRAEDLLRDADVAMYRAKNAGRARYEIFDSEMSAQAFERLRMEIDLRRALKRDQLRLHYQPLIGLSTGRIIGAEALVRWQHPEKGLIRPMDFIELAEESGVIFALGSWVLRTACAQAQAWSRAGLWGADGEDFHISVNVSAKQFHGPNLEEEIIRALAESQLEPRHLNLEITESVMLSGGSLVAQILTSLRKLGVQLAIDDFGTGFSSLSYLKKFPLDTLKIDRSFISASDLPMDQGVSNQQNPKPAQSQSSPAQDLAIVEAVHALGRALKMTVVAEGVETEEQARHLRDLGCEIGQGYFFARPLPPEEFGALLLRNPTW